MKYNNYFLKLKSDMSFYDFFKYVEKEILKTTHYSKNAKEGYLNIMQDTITNFMYITNLTRHNTFSIVYNRIYSDFNYWNKQFKDGAGFSNLFSYMLMIFIVKNSDRYIPLKRDDLIRFLDILSYADLNNYGYKEDYTLVKGYPLTEAVLIEMDYRLYDIDKFIKVCYFFGAHWDGEINENCEDIWSDHFQYGKYEVNDKWFRVKNEDIEEFQRIHCC